ncbi:HNH endonuclease signature motif containing protein [Paraburkholderia caballeronis]|uniref:HNH endonuclease n=1 Tax=Paraburkholderia caballeronis TaxID=416943 RepID=A0A1H7TYE1_9BURK|nr:HNH endonuclease signature motif containing protein [Paraburkholderia caballeronis]PXW23378.1 HNH endonuclease [Paraburkholderia caballeronis]PXW98371.1 HNH endonuclease [Paraburkholderia caballeronis]RAJ95101.1 HNH endonuclease [Paraburkholderia caballeronis]SEC57098.1 HNH endonuclease [Paraburkholderia caballeronis]SEL89446.1 HNH endonuclease [Paraburkholderia caballeronis]
MAKTSRHAGVSWNTAMSKWAAQVRFRRDLHHLGFFENEEEAHRVVVRFKVDNKIVKADGSRPSVLEAFRYDDGRLVCQYNLMKHSVGDIVGYVEPETGYVQIGYGSQSYRAHRLVWQMMVGPIPAGNEIDHINGDKADNRIENLRIVSRAENAKNLSLQTRNKTGVPGVAFINNHYRVTIGSEYLGYFDSLDEAVQIRKSAEARLGYHANHGRTK